MLSKLSWQVAYRGLSSFARIAENLVRLQQRGWSINENKGNSGLLLLAQVLMIVTRRRNDHAIHAVPRQ